MQEGEKVQRLALCAELMAVGVGDLGHRDCDYGRFCHARCYTDEVAGYLRQGKEFEVCLDFVRMMIQKHDKKQDIDEKGQDHAG